MSTPGPIPSVRLKTVGFSKFYVIAGIAFLLLLCACRMYWTWASWGNVSIDCGREVYVPARLAQGQVLYRDVWYHYGPAAPYLNSLFFRMFGVQLYVAFFAGAFSALASSIFLFLTGVELALPLVGWTAGAVVAIEAFEPGIFNFPLPYSFASVYGCAVACALLWALVRGLGRNGWLWMAGAGLLAALALLLKLEFGVAAYAALALAILLRWLPERQGKQLLQDLAAITPGLVVSAAVIGWMVSLRGVSFITEENIASWPTSFFMRVYGKEWLAHTGMALNRAAFLDMARHSMFTGAILLALIGLFNVKTWRLWRTLLVGALVLGIATFAKQLVWSTIPLRLAQVAFFPRAMVFYTVMGAVVAAWYLRPWTDLKARKLILVLAFPGLLAFRLLLNMQAQGYAIYYNGPVILAYLAILAMLFRPGRSQGQMAMAVAVVGCLAVVAFDAVGLSKDQQRLIPLVTSHGTLKVPEQTADNYKAAMQFMQEKKDRGEAVLLIPEDTMLYFLTDTRAPTRAYAFTPGIVAPGRMSEELFHQIETQDVRYLLWSNRTFPEYGVWSFGQDFNQDLARYLTERYQAVGPLVPGEDRPKELTLTEWKRRDAKAEP